jgi:hypothetical protein
VRSRFVDESEDGDTLVEVRETAVQIQRSRRSQRRR